MVVFPPCKINLGLHVLSKRSDGYHAIETCFYPVPWTDVLEIIPSEKFEFTTSGLPIAGRPEENICVKAYKLLLANEKVGPVHIHLHKILPSGAGLGGGSSDGAFTLTTLNTIFALHLDEKKLLQYARQLGSDCPFFIQPQPMIGTDRGQTLTLHSISLFGKFLVIISPPISVSTAEAYSKIKPRQPEMPLAVVLKKNISEWKDHLRNDFEASVFPEHPQLNAIKAKLYARGALYCSMSGSGSSVYGLFERPIVFGDDFAGLPCWSSELS